ncbi:dTMP kinase [Pseudoclavibacter soli]|uniref:dTMP kinase n=1 Tax=Pseudoclavibacter soli TaxID=452623 RepID=UPI000688D669|nr:dTMP kinase [Pseudoclavibacter soli]
MSRGVFISVEGIDGAGKSSRIHQLALGLREQGHEVVETLEPGATALGRELRELLLHTEGPIASRTEALLYAADRAQHVAEVVEPALARGAVVISDRYLDSSVAYQGGGRELSAREIRELSLWATGGLLPDLSILLDLPVPTALARVAGGAGAPDRLEREHIDFHQRVRDAFLRFAAAEPERFRVVSADQVPERVDAQVRQAVDEWFAAEAAVGVRGDR